MLAKLEITLGDAVFAVDIDFEKWEPTNRWQDTTHFHVDSEIHIILSGNALIEIGGKDVHINDGDICLLAPRSSHYPKIFSDTLKKTNFSFSLTHNYSFGKGQKDFSEYVYYSNIIINDKELLDIIRKLIVEEFLPENQHIYTARLALFFITLAKRIKEHNFLYKEQPVRGVSESENGFRQRKIVEEFFQKRYDEEVCIEDLAKQLCLSVPHTHRIVKKIFDEGFKKTLMKQRVEHACMLIKQGNLTLTEIAYRCGYTSYNGFLSAFKSYMKKTPKEYEKFIH